MPSEKTTVWALRRRPIRGETKRVIWPIGLDFFDSNRIVAGQCELRKDFRSFRADRIKLAKLQSERYPGRRRDLVKQWRAQVAAEDEMLPSATKAGRAKGVPIDAEQFKHRAAPADR
ncbi:WYL domain-containing protein [Bradyrhizobium diazoefficiens]|nr:WYL domain-containing protein [Bradyrhizobium diazoefficiens]WLA69211.1 WYL domain-containing protein [Bradyrhizobium diazoefficiens]